MKELNEAFLAKYPKYNKVLTMYSEANDCEPTWESLSKLNLVRFVEYMSERLAQSSVKTYSAMFKSVLNLYNEEVELPRDFEKVLSVKNVKSTNVWVTDSELQQIIDYVPQSETERIVKAQFLIGAFTGCRHSDYIRLDERNIVNGCISYVSQKTKTQAIVPLKPIVKFYLNQNRPRCFEEGNSLNQNRPHGFESEKSLNENRPRTNSESCLNQNRPRTFSDVTFNSTIRSICRKSGLREIVKVFHAGQEVEGPKWKFVSSHTARRSFATNLYLRGADLYSISRMMGHASTTMTEGYICCGLREQSPEVMEYFK